MLFRSIGVSLRVFTWNIDDDIGHLINPVLDLSEEMQDGDEGCLSFPGLVYQTPRAMRAVAKGFNEFGEPILIEGSELMARALQHETDHLNGILFIDRLPKDLRKEALADIRQSDWFLEAGSTGTAPTIKLSPHNTMGLGF